MAKTKLPYAAKSQQQIVQLTSAGRMPVELSRECGLAAQSIANLIAQNGVNVANLGMAMKV